MMSKAFLVSIGGYGGPVLAIVARDPQHAGELYAKYRDVTKSMSARKLYEVNVRDERGKDHVVKVKP